MSRHAGWLLVAVLVVLIGAGCAHQSSDQEAAPPEICGPKVEQEPCTSADIGVEYPTALLSHCEIGWAYIDGRYWVIEPPQPGGPNFVSGYAQLVTDHELSFRGNDGSRYTFKPAPESFSPPLCY